MNEVLKPVIEDLVDKFKGELSEFRGQTSVKLSPEHIVDVCQTLRDTHKFEMANSITAVDYWPELTPRFHVVYQFNSFSRKMRLEVRVPLDGNEPVLNSVTGVYPNTNWLERELWDLFGIRFEGHPDLRRILMPHDWEGHPLRKDYPLGYEEVQFTFNYEEILKRKPRPKE
jgi:NADH-quinone oxidoreductase subunit C